MTRTIESIVLSLLKTAYRAYQECNRITNTIILFFFYVIKIILERAERRKRYKFFIKTRYLICFAKGKMI